MLTIDRKTFGRLEKQYPGIGDAIRRYEQASVPACPGCGSGNTATVGCGLIGRTINIAGATTKFRLIPHGPKPGQYFCHACSKFFN
jgi:hypothetical protein